MGELNKPSLGETAEFLHFNVSHDEGLVVFGASRHLVGVDCMRCSPRGSRDTTQFLQQMKAHCTARDWAYIMGVRLPEQQIRRFMRVWTVKEAFVKAIGTGIYIDPERLECTFPASGSPQLSLDSIPQTDFHFRLEEEEAPDYVICVCVGPPSRAIEEYKKCMQPVRE
ncbi:4'-phosphopantetheinyl transferase, putative [Eimeria acervulina]|uniref:holo-[acyl-carrier-protein] synthase n=1 Tax=Eimeria acervulina TaxID=5801 RepID=U6GC75_EIMAC|nr:4'-phosphopantetheinyl transferase, putative [Eimeria acervulina]CDI76938.1 4'-phosphopantetheinyl transferase, putative [Eimeria acervulina]